MKKIIYYNQELNSYVAERPYELSECKGLHLLGSRSNYMHRMSFDLNEIPKEAEVKSAELSFYAWLTNSNVWLIDIEAPAPDEIPVEFYKVKDGNEFGQVSDVPDTTFDVINERVLLEHAENVYDTEYFYEQTNVNIDVKGDVSSWTSGETKNLGWLLKLPEEYKNERVLLSSETRIVGEGFPGYKDDPYMIRPKLTVVYEIAGTETTVELQNNDNYAGNKITAIVADGDEGINVFMQVESFSEEDFENQMAVIENITDEYYVREEATLPTAAERIDDLETAFMEFVGEVLA